jgi:hypothetical protein
MPSIINASSTGSGGIVQTADASGVLQLQSNGVTALSTSGANVTIAGTLTAAAQSIAKASLPTGSILQVVQVTDTSPTNITPALSTWYDISLSASITPTSSTSKILIMPTFEWQNVKTNNTLMRMAVRILRGSTSLYSAGKENWASDMRAGTSASSDVVTGGTFSTFFLDSPATTSSTTYKVQVGDVSGNVASLTYQINEAGTMGIILLEVAA